MNIMKKLWILALLALCACKEEEPQMLQYAGLFMAEQLTADVPVDLNFDGVYSTDFLSETIHRIGGLKYHLSISHTPHSNSIGYELMVVWIRHLPEDGTTILGLGGRSSRLRFNPEIREFYQILDDFPAENESRRGISMVEGIEVQEIRPIDTDHIFVKLKYDERVYDVWQNEWKTVIVDGVFKRRQDN
jgi:hypothetical protein